jgi:hypothetical protein
MELIEIASHALPAVYDGNLISPTTALSVIARLPNMGAMRLRKARNPRQDRNLA